MATTIHCECCGAPGARTVPAPSGGEMDACKPCETYGWRQAAIDARYTELADTEPITVYERGA